MKHYGRKMSEYIKYFMFYRGFETSLYFRTEVNQFSKNIKLYNNFNGYLLLSHSRSSNWRTFDIALYTIHICIVLSSLDLVILGGKCDFKDYCRNKGFTFIKNRSAYSCPQLPVRINLKSGRLLYEFEFLKQSARFLVYSYREFQQN